MPLSSGPEGALDDQYRAFRRYIHAFLAPLALAILFSSVLFLAGLPYLMLIAIARPLRALVAGVERFDRDQQHRPIPVQFNDEIGFLTQSFNALTSALDDVIRNLETRVADRTSDLLNANAELRKLSVAVEQSPSAIMNQPAGRNRIRQSGLLRVHRVYLRGSQGPQPALPAIGTDAARNVP